MTVHLATARLILRRLTAADAGALRRLHSDPEVMRWITGRAPSPGAAGADLAGFLSSYDPAPGFGVWAAAERDDPSGFLGWFSLRRASGPPPPEARQGYRLVRAVWGRGYATEGARALVHAAFAEMGARRVAAATYERNAASRRVLEKSGLAPVRWYRLALPDARDVWEGFEVEYAIGRSHWEAARAARAPLATGDRAAPLPGADWSSAAPGGRVLRAAAGPLAAAVPCSGGLARLRAGRSGRR